MATQNTAVVNFGTGAREASVAVASAGVSGSSLVEAWPQCNELIGSVQDDTARLENFQVVATEIVAGVGFNIYVRPALGVAHGSFNISWVYNP